MNELPLDQKAIQAFVQRFERSRKYLRRDVQIYGVCTLLFWIFFIGTRGLFSAGDSSPPSPWIRWPLSILSMVWLFFGFAVIFRIRIMAALLKKSRPWILFSQLGAFLLIALGGPFLFSRRLLNEARGLLDSGSISSVMVERKPSGIHSRFAAILINIITVGILVGLLAMISIPGLISARTAAAIKQGRTFMEQGLYENAVTEFRKVTRENSAHTAVYFPLGVSLYRLGQFQEARQALERFLKEAEEEETFYAKHPDLKPPDRDKAIEEAKALLKALQEKEPAKVS